MRSKSPRSAALAILLLASAATACTNEPEYGGADTESVVSRNRAEPMTVAGCLRAGTGTNTFVLTTSQTGGQVEAATYNLTGTENSKMQEHVGQQVQVTGTLVAETQIVREGTTAPQEKAQGTTGTPSVDTKTEMDVKRMDVTAVTPMGRKCEAD
jgi:hypothetical protein